MIAEKVLSINYVWSADSCLSHRLQREHGHKSPVVACPPLFAGSRSWYVARPARFDLSRPDVKLPMFENIYDYDVDSILFELFQHCEREVHPVPDIKMAVTIANSKFRVANMRRALNVVARQMPAEIVNGVNVYASPFCPPDRIYVLAHNEYVGALAKHGIQFGIGVWHPGACIGFSLNSSSTINLLDLMVELDRTVISGD